jgi:CDP-diacylglycerol--glycerol-3-phosphate 3-phosphatidyltransferase
MSLALSASLPATTTTPTYHHADSERARAANYPLSRWYLRPLAGVLAARLASTRVTPCQVSGCGLLAASSAAAVLVTLPQHAWLAALLTLGYWFCDRTDGQLARLRGSSSEFGAWFDANIDELADIALHTALAFAAAESGSPWAWPCLLGFLAGKYLLMYGLFVEAGVERNSATHRSPHTPCEDRLTRSVRSTMARLYHLPGNADVRLHLVVLATASGQFTAELAFVAAYYNLRWLARYALVARRLGGSA